MSVEFDSKKFLETIPAKSHKTFDSFINMINRNPNVLKMTEQEILDFINANDKWKTESTKHKQVKMFIGCCLFRLNVRTDIAKCVYGQRDDKVNHYDNVLKELKYYTLNKIVDNSPPSLKMLFDKYSCCDFKHLIYETYFFNINSVTRIP